MIEMSFKYRGGIPGSRGMSKRDYNALRRQALEAVGNYWHDHFRARHFTQEGAKIYGYTPRSGEGSSGKSFWRSYSGRKQKYLGHHRPLVFTGKTEQLSRKRRFSIAARGDRATLRIIIPAPALNFRNPNSKIDMRKEMTTVIPEEERAMSRVYVETLVMLMTGFRRLVEYRPGSSSGEGPMGMVGGLAG